MVLVGLSQKMCASKPWSVLLKAKSGFHQTYLGVSLPLPWGWPNNVLELVSMCFEKKNQKRHESHFLAWVLLPLLKKLYEVGFCFLRQQTSRSLLWQCTAPNPKSSLANSLEKAVDYTSGLVLTPYYSVSSEKMKKIKGAFYFVYSLSSFGLESVHRCRRVHSNFLSW